MRYPGGGEGAGGLTSVCRNREAIPLGIALQRNPNRAAVIVDVVLHHWVVKFLPGSVYLVCLIVSI